ncbi:UvrD-helicase domain-containing protein [Pontibacter akesuensis]|uniref:DNA 3'-5' helicase n=1 Tax=Pontibacter akesuensis TaxID=388950 RepID=A0A1I7JY04_9BACT|nr:ATP-dependent helicase [Pontibacter akesuensis]GHA76689.1 hypothetical protein GCM10007389_33350 [Pontibacter akesuensis]SFU90024.1 ATP-dependent DNA helicase RecQ [Pontibacter akesuensis]
MIERLNDQVAYNPVREHISIGFQLVQDKEQRIETIVEDLLNQEFDPVLSRVLVFVRTRKLAEEATEELIDFLSKKEVAWADKVGLFHAGMDSSDREINYEDFEAGRKVILVATKAFGMGMDIKNIHYIYHLSPSSTFEDFLQEVGRAGRDKAELQKAGFSEEKPIRAKCVMTKSDFRSLQDLNHKGSVSWNNIKLVQRTLFEYIGKFRKVNPDPENPFPLPFDLLNSYPQFEDEFDRDTLFRLSLYWLERLNRVRLGLFTPAFLPIKILKQSTIAPNVLDVEERSSLQNFISFIKSYQSAKFPEGESVAIPMEEIRRITGKKRNSELFKFLFRAQKAGAISIERTVTLEPTKTRASELEKWTSYNGAPTLEAVFNLAEKILTSVRPCEQMSFSGDYLDQISRHTIDEYFSKRRIFWKEYKKNGEEIPVEEIAKNLRNDFIAKRAKFAFKIISMLPGMRHRSIIEAKEDRKKPEVVQLVYNGNSEKNACLPELIEFKSKLQALISHVGPMFFRENVKVFNYADLVLKLGLEGDDHEYLRDLIFISKGLGYLKGEGSFIPMGIELFIDDTSDIDERDRASKDYQVFQEFEEGVQMKELRLLSLECLSTLNKDQQDAFIKKYFSCSSSSDLVSLLEEHFGEDHENLKAFRKEALFKAEEKLNNEQRAVYDAPIDSNLQVIAGPGSGKTHTLTLRVAKLIQKEQISPEQILVLAYNRAVVVELKDRLNRLFKDLGYAKLISRLKVFNFHQFCLHCLDNNLDRSNFDSWVPAFIKELEQNPGRISQKLGQIKYVFVDEFQDITNERLKLLEKIANPGKTKICVIGDPNQSIYGYDRVKEGGAMSPRPYYDKFKQSYQPKELSLSTNYRSYPNILTAAKELISKNTSEFGIPELVANRIPEIDRDYCEIFNFRETKVSWRDKLLELLNEEYEQGKQYRQIAVMYRSNEEVFKSFNDLQNMGLQGVRVRIQGASTSPFRSREFFHFVQSLELKSKEILPSSFIHDFEQEKSKVIRSNSNWDSYLINLFHCLLKEFQVEKSDESTYQDLTDFIEDVSGKDDGHFSKIFDKHINDIDAAQSVREVVITTMHKVKGVEFDAVIIPPSFSDFASREDTNSGRFKELVEEERRLLYVAYTRARYRLVVIKFDRELAIDDSRSFVFSADVRQRLGVVVPQQIDKLFISWGAKEFNNSTFKLINDKVSVGDPVELIKDNFGGWEVRWRNIQIGKLKSNQLSHTIQHNTLKGFNISSIVYYTHAESMDYDERHGTSYTKNSWGPSAVARGYIYLVDFSGYGQA